MDCAAFFEAVDARLGEWAEAPNRTTVGEQCVVEFYHPRTVARLGDGSLVARFNRSGVVWAPRADHLKVKLRVPAAHRAGVVAALAAVPFPVDETDHRIVGAPDGEMVTVLHFSISTDGVTPDEVGTTLDALAAALAI